MQTFKKWWYVPLGWIAIVVSLVVGLAAFPQKAAAEATEQLIETFGTATLASGDWNTTGFTFETQDAYFLTYVHIWMEKSNGDNGTTGADQNLTVELRTADTEWKPTSTVIDTTTFSTASLLETSTNKVIYFGVQLSASTKYSIIWYNSSWSSTERFPEFNYSTGTGTRVRTILGSALTPATSTYTVVTNKIAASLYGLVEVNLVAPTNCVATLTTVSGVEYPQIVWDDNSDNEDGFVLQRSTVSNFASYTEMITQPAGTEIAVDYWVPADDDYYYRVAAYKGLLANYVQSDWAYSNMIAAEESPSLVPPVTSPPWVPGTIPGLTDQPWFPWLIMILIAGACWVFAAINRQAQWGAAGAAVVVAGFVTMGWLGAGGTILVVLVVSTSAILLTRKVLA